jgi:TPR repeat protein
MVFAKRKNERALRNAAEGGDPQAMYDLATQLRRTGSPQALGWLQRAAEAGHVEAMNSMGLMCSGEGKVEEAEAWFRRAAEHDHLEAVHNVAQVLLQRQDPEALSWFRRAAELGHPRAMYNLAVLLQESGAQEALPWFRKAADLGNVDAMYNLGVALYRQGQLEEAAKWLQAAADRGDEQAGVSLQLVQMGQRDDIVHINLQDYE